MKKLLLVGLLVLAACDSVQPAPQNSTAGLSPADIVAKDIDSRAATKDAALITVPPKLSNERTIQELGEYSKIAISKGRAEWKRLIGKPGLPDWKVELLLTRGQTVESPCNDSEGKIILQMRGKELFPFAFCVKTNTFYVALPLLQQLMRESGYAVQAQQPGLLVALLADGMLAPTYISEIGVVGGPSGDDAVFFANCVAGALVRGAYVFPPQWQIMGALEITGVYNRHELRGNPPLQSSGNLIGVGLRSGLGECIRYLFK